jgi:beta-1,4-mannooligosaccharide/beta-1,4-mannosyl-N-acetylglucosamine phosphorylase
MSVIVNGSPLPNLPWAEKPKGYGGAVWRYDGNPIIPRDLIPSANSIFNSAVTPFGDGFAGVFRCDDKSRYMDLHAGFSKDGIRWTLEDEVIRFTAGDAEVLKSDHRYDPRVCFIEDRYYITWCNGYHGPTIGMGYTFDFKTFYAMENAFLPCNRNGVLFPRKINGQYMMLSRPSDYGHTPFGDIFLSRSPDLTYWGGHRHVMHTVDEANSWQKTKIGAGPIPIETTEGWLIFYHGVLTSCNGYVYSFGAAITDIDEPWRVKYRTRPYLLSPQTLYECVGDVPNVVFPCAALTDADTGRIAVYYGCADTTTGLCFCRAEELIAFIKNNSY